jgi:hypothetical protein
MAPPSSAARAKVGIPREVKYTLMGFRSKRRPAPFFFVISDAKEGFRCRVSFFTSKTRDVV